MVEPSPAARYSRQMATGDREPNMKPRHSGTGATQLILTAWLRGCPRASFQSHHALASSYAEHSTLPPSQNLKVHQNSGT